MTASFKRRKEMMMQAEEYRRRFRMCSEKKQELNWQEFEQYRDQIYEISSAAEEAGFINGFKYAVMLMSECYARDTKIIGEP